MNLPQLPPEQIREEDTPGYEKEIFEPRWNCFCCEDNGIVRPGLAIKVIPQYNHNTDKLPICQNPGCSAGSNWAHFGPANVDMRLTASICRELDALHREDWKRTVKIQTERAKAVQSATYLFTQKKNMRKGDRTEHENAQVQKRKVEIESISHSEWVSMAKSYLGQDFFESAG